MKAKDYVVLKNQPQLIRRIVEIVGDDAKTICYNTKNEEGRRINTFPLSELRLIPSLATGDLVTHEWNEQAIRSGDQRTLGIVLGGNHVVTKVVWPYMRTETNVKTMNLIRLGKLQWKS